MVKIIINYYEFFRLLLTLYGIYYNRAGPTYGGQFSFFFYYFFRKKKLLQIIIQQFNRKYFRNHRNTYTWLLNCIGSEEIKITFSSYTSYTLRLSSGSIVANKKPYFPRRPSKFFTEHRRQAWGKGGRVKKAQKALRSNLKNP